MVLTLFVLISLTVFIAIGQPVKILVTVGALNGFILPIALVLIIAASYNKKIVGTYQHPLWLKLFGWMVMIASLLLSIRSFI
ncbi:MAG: hypothetical protein RLZZ333_1837 [Bacteroidota bacterium]